MTIKFTILAPGHRLHREFTPQQCMEAARQLRERREELKNMPFTILMTGEDGVTHVVVNRP